MEHLFDLIMKEKGLGGTLQIIFEVLMKHPEIEKLLDEAIAFHLAHLSPTHKE